MANLETAKSLDGLVTANASMAQAHRDLAQQMKDVRDEARSGWATFNRRAWLALGAIAMSFLAAGLGSVMQTLSARDVANKAAAIAPNQQATNAKQQQILNELAAIHKQLGP